ncbi:hypothetical protein HZB00_02050 [Candidatus Woesearchaeota archaeon]|nr:hypothetical protein [Candidatus Woesearchaeota archaeon]
MKKEIEFPPYMVVLVAIIGILLAFNQYQLATLSPGSTFGVSSSSIPLEGGFKVKNPTGDAVQDAINTIITTGTPTYGPELGVTFDDPVKSLNILASLHGKLPTASLTPQEKERYIAVGTKISCEFCCGAPSVVDQQGRDLCGCAHAQSFMGLSKYLIKNHPDWSNEQILTELTKWKSLYYPKNMVEKAAALIQNKLPLTPEALNDPKLLNKISAGDASKIGEALPAMVGGC